MRPGAVPRYRNDERRPGGGVHQGAVQRSAAVRIRGVMTLTSTRRFSGSF
jgi:hypothetical protein